MRKLFLSVAIVLGLGVAVVSCSKDDDKKDGKKAGEKYCKCVESAGTDIDAWDKCQEYPAKALEESSEYQKGYAEGVLSCME